MVVHIAAEPAFREPLGDFRESLRLPDARELDAEVTRLLRVRSGELAEPLHWQRPSHRAAVEAIVAQLAPMRSRLGLLSSYQREARRDSPLRLGYAIAWLRLAHRRPGEFGPRRRPTGFYPKTKAKSVAKR